MTFNSIIPPGLCSAFLNRLKQGKIQMQDTGGGSRHRDGSLVFQAEHKRTIPLCLSASDINYLTVP